MKIYSELPTVPRSSHLGPRDNVGMVDGGSPGRRAPGVSFDAMAARRAERLINLVIALLWTRQFLTAERIREVVPGYDRDDGSERGTEAFKRMFERDKAELRDLGIPLETGRTSIADVEDGYRIPRRDYELPPIDFDPAEAAAVGLAARLWQSATLAAPARTALLKLRAGGTELDPDATLTPGPRVDASDPSLAPLLAAVRDQQVVRFGYRSAGASTSERRTVEPWGVLSWQQRWYLVGYDVQRAAQRSFRLSRIVGSVEQTRMSSTTPRPADLDMVAVVSRRQETRQRATVRLRPGGAARVRRLAAQVAPRAAPGGDDVAEIEFNDTRWLAREIAAAGAAAWVVDPPELITAVRELLTGSGDVNTAVRSTPNP